MPFFIADTGRVGRRIARRWVHGFCPGPERVDTWLVMHRWVSNGTAWQLSHRDGGITAARDLSVLHDPPLPSDTTMLFAATWVADLPEMPYSDYELVGWWIETNGIVVDPVEVTNGGRNVRLASAPADVHVLRFSVRRQARTDGDPGGHTLPGPALLSPLIMITDPREES